MIDRAIISSLHPRYHGVRLTPVSRFCVSRKRIQNLLPKDTALVTQHGYTSHPFPPPDCVLGFLGSCCGLACRR